MPEVQFVRVILQICGDYCAFHETTCEVMYDLTNKKQTGYMTWEEIEEALQKEYSGDYCDIQETDAVLINGQYYYQI